MKNISLSQEIYIFSFIFSFLIIQIQYRAKTSILSYIRQKYLINSWYIYTLKINTTLPTKQSHWEKNHQNSRIKNHHLCQTYKIHQKAATHLQDMIEVPVVVPFELLPHAPDGVDKAVGQVAVEQEVPKGFFKALRADKYVPGDREHHCRHQVLCCLLSSSG